MLTRREALIARRIEAPVIIPTGHPGKITMVSDKTAAFVMCNGNGGISGWYDLNDLEIPPDSWGEIQIRL